MKKVILGVLALLFAIALVIGGYILLAPRALQSYAAEEGVPCPYSWQEQKDGTYRLEINTAAYPDYGWSVECYPKNVLAVAEADGEAGTAAFHILPLNMGQTYVQVYCEQTQPFTVRIFEIDLSVSVSEEGEITVEKTEHKVYDGVAEMGLGSDYPIQWWQDSNGGVNLLILGGESVNWEVVEFNSYSLDVTGPFYRQGDCGFEIKGLSGGTFPLVLYDGRDTAMTLEISVAADLTVSITGFAVDTYTVDRSAEHAALEAVVGDTVVLPPEATVTTYFVKSEKGSVDFLMNELEWEWELAPGVAAKTLVEEYAANASEKKISYARGRTLTAYRFTDGVVVSWRDGTCGMALYGERDLDLAGALAVASQIVEANYG